MSKAARDMGALIEQLSPGQRHSDYDEELSVKANAANLIALGRRLNHVVEVCGISRRTLGRWRDDDVEFRKLLEAVRIEYVVRARDRAAAFCTQVIEDEDQRMSDRLKAADLSMRHAAHFENRLDKMGIKPMSIEEVPINTPEDAMRVLAQAYEDIKLEPPPLARGARVIDVAPPGEEEKG